MGVFAAADFTGHNNFNCKQTCSRDINLPKYDYTVFLITNEDLSKKYYCMVILIKKKKVLNDDVIF